MMHLKPFLLPFLAFGLSVSVAFCKEASVSDGCEHSDEHFRCVKYVRNYDADTITVDIPDVHAFIGKAVSVRIKHIDTPEVRTRNKCEKDRARVAKSLIENQLKNAKRIDLMNVEKDKYFRILADVMVDGKSLADVLLKNQLAYPYEGGTKRKVDWCKPISRISSGGSKF